MRAARKRLYCAVKEAAVLRSLPTSDHVVQFRGFYSDGPFTYIVMERCASGLLPFFLQMSSVTEEPAPRAMRSWRGRRRGWAQHGWSWM